MLEPRYHRFYELAPWSSWKTHFNKHTVHKYNAIVNALFVCIRCHHYPDGNIETFAPGQVTRWLPELIDICDILLTEES